MTDAEMQLDGWERLDDEGFFSLIGPAFLQPVEPGHARFRFYTQEVHRNRSGYIHGGLLLALADRTMGLTARETDRDRRHVTVQLDMHFIHAVRAGAVVELECRIVSAKRTLAFLSIEMMAEGQLIAAGKGVWRNLAQ
jgi:uncharacterized protein (TIGR00369 family)